MGTTNDKKGPATKDLRDNSAFAEEAERGL